MFLTKEAIEQMTGYKFAASQVKWLRRAGVRFTVNRYGHPLVLEKHIEELLCDAPRTGIKKRIEPDMDALEKTIGLR